MNASADNSESGTPVWAIFGDLMSALVGVFVLLLVWVMGVQLELTRSLEEEVAKRQAEEQRRMSLEEALADPLAAGRVTFRDGRIGIAGSVLFGLNSDQLEPQGKQILRELVMPLQRYLDSNDELLMVSGFTDDLPIQQGNRRYADNWDLSAQRALTVTRTLIELGMPSDAVFAAAFGPYQAVVPNVDDASRAQNRRVEINAVPRPAANTALDEARP